MNPWPPFNVATFPPVVGGPRRKPHRRYLAYRVFAAFTLVGWNALLLLSWFSGSRDGLRYVGGFVPFMIVALVMLFNWAAFPLAYSVFGPFERSDVPEQAPIYTADDVSARVGRLELNGPFVQLDVLPSGLALYFFGQSAFVPREQFLSCERLSFGRTKLTHRSAEVRSPLIVNNAALADALGAIWPREAAPPAAWPNSPWPTWRQG